MTPDPAAAPPDGPRHDIVVVAGHDLVRDGRALRHARELARDGHRVSLHGVHLEGTEKEEDHGDLLVVRSALAPWAWRDRGPGAALRVARWFRRTEPVLREALTRRMPTLIAAYGVDVLLPCAAAAGRLGVPLVVDDDLRGRAASVAAEGSGGSARVTAARVLARRENALRRRCLPTAHAVTTSSLALADHLATLGARDPAVVRDALPATEAGREDALRVRVGAFPGERLLFLAGDPDETDARAAVRSLAHLGEGHVLVLSGFTRDRGALEREAAAASRESALRFLPPLPPAERLLLLASADVALVPSSPRDPLRRLALPQPLLEAVAAGTPVAVTDLPSVRALLLRWDLGRSFPDEQPLEPRAVAEAVRSVLSGPPSHAAVRARVRGAAAGALSWDRQRAGLTSIYRHVAGGTGPRIG